MQAEPAERRRRAGRRRRGEGGHGRAEEPGTQPRPAGSSTRGSEEEMARMQQNERPVGGTGSRDDEEEEEERGRDRRRTEREVRSRRAASEGGDRSEKLRWRVHQLERERLELTSGDNQEVCRLQAELTRLRASVERGEAQRVELRYRLTASQRDKRALTERGEELQQTVQELQKARDEDQHALQREAEERDRLVRSCSSENQRLLRLLQDQQAALEESEKRRQEVMKERDAEAEVNRRQAGELKYLAEREERSRREKEVSDQRSRSLEASVEAERAAHLESKFNSEIIQLRGRDLEAALVAERSSQQEALSSLELLRVQFREVERAYGLERERSSGTERALEGLQKEFEQCKSDLSVALETERTTTSDLTERLEEEQRLHADTHTLLEQAVKSQSDVEECLKHVRETLQQHSTTVKDHGSSEVLQLLKATLSSDQRRLEAMEEQIRDQLAASERLQEENQTLRRLTSDQSRRLEESQEEVGRLRQESSDWSTRCGGLQAELGREREESTARLSFLYCLYQRLLAGCVLLHQPQSILGNFTWEELRDVINEQVDRVTSDLREANDKIAHLQSVCEKKSVCVRELQRGQKCVLSRLEESVRRREEAWSRRHTHTVTQLQEELQVCRDHASSLELRGSSLTSDLSRLRGEAACFLAACALLAGALTHTQRRLQALCGQKALLSRRLAEREQLEEEVRRLAGALEVKEEEEEGRRKRRRAVRRWRRSVCVVLAARRWRALTRQTAVLLRLERGGAPAVCVATPTWKGHDAPGTDEDDEDGDEGHWLRSKSLSAAILSSTADLQGALTHTGSSPPVVMSAACYALSRLLDHILDQSAPCGEDEDTLSGRLRLGLSRLTPPRPDAKTLVSALQQHFLLFSQRLHSAEVERRGLRLEVANLKRGRRQEREEETCRTVPVRRFHSVCVELRQALSREQEAQTLIQEQTNQLQALQLHAAEHAATQRTLNQTSQSLSEARQEVSRKERSLRILGKHLSGVQRERKQLEERVRQVEDELSAAARRTDRLLGNMKAAETSYKEVRESLLHSQRSPSAKPRPLPLPREHLELGGAEGIMGAPELAALQSLLSSVAQLHHASSSRIDWLEQEVSAHRGHVTALRGELQDACLRDNLAYVPVAEFPESILQPDWSKEPPTRPAESDKSEVMRMKTS